MVLKCVVGILGAVITILVTPMFNRPPNWKAWPDVLATVTTISLKFSTV